MKTIATTTLASLAASINTEHAAATKSAESAIEHARRCGDMLLRAKAEVGHGGFLSWLAANCKVGERQARNYMRVAEAKSAPGSDLSIKEALRLTMTDRATDGGMPTLSRSHVLRCEGEDGRCAIIIPIGGCYFYVGVTSAIDGEQDAVVDETKRGVREEHVSRTLKVMGFRPEGEWDRRPLSGDDMQYVTEMRQYWAAKHRAGDWSRGN